MPGTDIERASHRIRRVAAVWAIALVLATSGLNIGLRLSEAQAEMAAPSSTTVSTPLPPSREITSSIGAMTSHNPGKQGDIPSGERKVLIVLLALCFAVMAFAGGRLLRHGLADLLRAGSGPARRK